MNRSHTKYLLIGGGLAAASATAAIRNADTPGSILLVARETTRPYHRKNLPSLVAQAHPDRSMLYVHPADWYDQQHVTLRTGRQVEAIDPTRNCVTLDNAEQISYERLLIATGANPNKLNVPGTDLPGVFSLRTLDDADRLANSLHQAQAEGRPHEHGRGRISIVGAGMLGMDLVGRLLGMNLHVDLIEAGAHPWPYMAGEGIGRYFLRKLIDHGAIFQGQTHPVGLEGDGRVQSIVIGPSAGQQATALKRLPSDLVIVALGASPAKEIVRHTAIAAERAILVDEFCRTNIEGIFAAGDCAAVQDPLFGKYRLSEPWDTAEETGRIAGINMSGGNVSLTSVSHFRTQVLGESLHGWGDHRQVSHRLYRAPTHVSSRQLEFGIAADGRLAQVLSVGDWPQADLSVLEHWVKTRRQMRGIEEKLKDPAVDLATL